VDVPGVSGAETHVHTHAPGESKAHNRLPDSILSSTDGRDSLSNGRHETRDGRHAGRVASTACATEET
nr:hypothetical protein [Tanacetum cinerariifolium]